MNLEDVGNKIRTNVWYYEWGHSFNYANESLGRSIYLSVYAHIFDGILNSLYIRLREPIIAQKKQV
jgi:hypothetical protein